MDYFAELKKECANQMGAHVGCAVANTAEGIHKALTYAMARAKYVDDKAKAIMIASAWQWADCEETYHKMKEEKKGN